MILIFPLLKRLSVAYAMAWIEIEEREATRRGYFYGAECENGQNTYLSPLGNYFGELFHCLIFTSNSS